MKKRPLPRPVAKGNSLAIAVFCLYVSGYAFWHIGMTLHVTVFVGYSLYAIFIISELGEKVKEII